MIDLNELLLNGADEDSMIEALRKNMAEKKAEEEKKLKEDEEAAQREELLHEARLNLINAILAYDDVFHFFGDEPVDEDTIHALETAIVRWEPLLANLRVRDVDVSAETENMKKWIANLWRLW